MRYFSPSTGGFYHADIHGEAMPEDAVSISAKKHALLLEAQSNGAAIVAGKKGPIARMPVETRADALLAARGRVRREARRRRLAIASLELQGDDVAILSQAAIELQLAGATEADFAPALERRRRLSAVQAAAAAIELSLDNLSTGDLTAFRASDAAWPETEGAA